MSSSLLFMIFSLVSYTVKNQLTSRVIIIEMLDVVSISCLPYMLRPYKSHPYSNL